MRIIEAKEISDAVYKLCISTNIHLSGDVKTAIKNAQGRETFPVAKDVLDKIIDNFEIADRENVPVCQDTGMACVFIDIGDEVYIKGNINDAVNDGVRRSYADAYFRKSVVGDPLRRVNTNDNTPAIVYTEFCTGDKVTVTVAPKGFGSENMSAIKMLKPSDGREGVVEFVLDTVRLAGPNPCPPIVIGIGLGGTFDKAALLAKRALLVELGAHNDDPYYAELENEILQKVNELGIGPQGFGGRTTAISVAIKTYPTHIAGLPVAVNINCHVARHAGEVL